MNTRELRAERIRQNKSIEHMARVISKSHDTYAKKERGAVKFFPEEIASVSNELSLTPVMFNAIFFDSKLLFGKSLYEVNTEL